MALRAVTDARTRSRSWLQAPIKAAIASEWGITLADTLTEALESGGAQFKKRFHRSSNKQQVLAPDANNSCADQLMKLEQLHRKVKTAEVLTAEWERSQSHRLPAVAPEAEVRCVSSASFTVCC